MYPFAAWEGSSGENGGIKETKGADLAHILENTPKVWHSHTSSELAKVLVLGIFIAMAVTGALQFAVLLGYVDDMGLLRCDLMRNLSLHAVGGAMLGALFSLWLRTSRRRALVWFVIVTTTLCTAKSVFWFEVRRYDIGFHAKELEIARLQDAIWIGDTRAVERILDSGLDADVNSRSADSEEEDETLVEWAIQHRQYDCALVLMKHGNIPREYWFDKLPPGTKYRLTIRVIGEPKIELFLIDVAIHWQMPLHTGWNDQQFFYKPV